MVTLFATCCHYTVTADPATDATALQLILYPVQCICIWCAHTKHAARSTAPMAKPTADASLPRVKYRGAKKDDTTRRCKKCVSCVPWHTRKCIILCARCSCPFGSTRKWCVFSWTKFTPTRPTHMTIAHIASVWYENGTHAASATDEQTLVACNRRRMPHTNYVRYMPPWHGMTYQHPHSCVAEYTAPTAHGIRYKSWPHTHSLSQILEKFPSSWTLCLFDLFVEREKVWRIWFSVIVATTQIWILKQQIFTVCSVNVSHVHFMIGRRHSHSRSRSRHRCRHQASSSQWLSSHAYFILRF